MDPSEGSRIQPVARASDVLRRREQDELAQEGYAFYARESREFAASSLRAASEATWSADDTAREYPTSIPSG